MPKKIQLLVISPSCYEPVNRAVYRWLAAHHPIAIHLVVPRFRQIGLKKKDCAPAIHEPYSMLPLNLIGISHIRFQIFKGLSGLIRRERFTHILVEADPASLMTYLAIRATNGFSNKVWVLTNENIKKNFIQESQSSLFRGHVVKALAKWLAHHFLTFSQKKLDQVFTISHEGTRAMSESGFEGRVTKMPLGFDPDLFYPQSKEKIEGTRRRLGLTKKTVAYFGRLSQEKGIKILFQALGKIMDLDWQLLLDRFSEYSSPYENKLKKEIEILGIGHRVVYFDASHSEMPDYINAADIVVLPSISSPTFKEQYGRVIPEAMACGKIVVGSTCGAIPELIGDGGSIFPEGDVSDLAEKLRLLLTAPDDSLRSLRDRACDRAVTYLSIQRQGEIFVKKLFQD